MPRIPVVSPNSCEARLGIPVVDPTRAAVVRLVGMMMPSHAQVA